MWFSDLHLGDPAWQAGEIDAVLVSMKAKTAKFIVASGDNIHNNDADEKTLYDTAISTFTIPIYTLEGNHDAPYFDDHFTVESYGVKIIAFHGTYVALEPTIEDPFANTANVSAEELAWIESELQTGGARRKILMCHWPISYDIWGHIDDDQGRPELIALANNYGANLYLSGHAHGNGETYVVDGINNVSGAAVVSRASGRYMVCNVYTDRIVIDFYGALTPFAFVKTVTVYY